MRSVRFSVLYNNNKLNSPSSFLLIEASCIQCRQAFFTNQPPCITLPIDHFSFNLSATGHRHPYLTFQFFHSTCYRFLCCVDYDDDGVCSIFFSMKKLHTCFFYINLKIRFILFKFSFYVVNLYILSNVFATASL